MTTPQRSSGCSAPIGLFAVSFFIGVSTMSDPSLFLVTLLALLAGAVAPFWGFFRLATHPKLGQMANRAAVNLEIARQNTREEARRQRAEAERIRRLEEGT